MDRQIIQQRANIQKDEVLDLRKKERTESESELKYEYDSERIPIEIKDVVRVLPEDIKQFRQHYHEFIDFWDKR